MKKIEIKNKELIILLEDFSTWFEEKGKPYLKLEGEPDENEYYTSEEYFNSINKEKHIGFPEKAFGIDMGLFNSSNENLKARIRKIDSDLNSILGSKMCAVKMHYPKGGYMGWHNNHNCPGYNILFSYTKNGNGFFRYKDPITMNTHTMFDEKGWTAKVGYFGDLKEKEHLYWHCARANEDRLTLGFVIPDKQFWEYMIEDIEDSTIYYT